MSAVRRKKKKKKKRGRCDDGINRVVTEKRTGDAHINTDALRTTS